MKEKMPLSEYQKGFRSILRSVSRPAAKVTCIAVFELYLKYGIFPNLVYVQAIAACSDGHLTNPPRTLPDLEVEITTTSAFYRNLTNKKQTLRIKEVEENSPRNLPLDKIERNCRNASTLIRVFTRYAPEYFSDTSETRTCLT